MERKEFLKQLINAFVQEVDFDVEDVTGITNENGVIWIDLITDKTIAVQLINVNPGQREWEEFQNADSS